MAVTVHLSAFSNTATERVARFEEKSRRSASSKTVGRSPESRSSHSGMQRPLVERNPIGGNVFRGMVASRTPRPPSDRNLSRYECGGPSGVFSGPISLDARCGRVAHLAFEPAVLALDLDPGGKVVPVPRQFPAPRASFGVGGHAEVMYPGREMNLRPFQAQSQTLRFK